MVRPPFPTTEEIAEANFNAAVANLSVNLLILDIATETRNISLTQLRENRIFHAELLALLKERLK